MRDRWSNGSFFPPFPLCSLLSLSPLPPLLSSHTTNLCQVDLRQVCETSVVCPEDVLVAQGRESLEKLQPFTESADGRRAWWMELSTATQPQKHSHPQPVPGAHRCRGHIYSLLV